MQQQKKLMESLEDKVAKRQQLFRELSQSLNVSELLKSLGVELVEGESIRLTPIVMDNRVVAVRHEGTAYYLKPSICCDEWQKNCGPLRRK